MRKLILALLVLSVAFVSCEKEHEDAECESIDSKFLPKAAVSNFEAKYPQQTVIKWFVKDDKGYVAYFKTSIGKKLAYFDTEGKFLKEKNEQQCSKKEKDDDGCEVDVD
jgi:hypothetical protein